MDEDVGTSSEIDDSVAPDLGDEWKNWRVDDREFESDESAEEGVTKEEKEAFELRRKVDWDVCGTC